VRSLVLETNLAVYGPYGTTTEGIPFELSAPGSQIIGFYGRSGIYLDAIGVYVQVQVLLFSFHNYSKDYFFFCCCWASANYAYMYRFGSESDIAFRILYNLQYLFLAYTRIILL
jgi:Jacalin-like lectin domain